VRLAYIYSRYVEFGPLILLEALGCGCDPIIRGGQEITPSNLWDSGHSVAGGNSHDRLAEHLSIRFFGAPVRSNRHCLLKGTLLDMVHERMGELHKAKRDEQSTKRRQRNCGTHR
jgi:hypothetical protein